MAFEYRKLTAEEREYVASFEIDSGVGGGLAGISCRGVVLDTERDIYLFDAGGQGWKNDSDFPPTVLYLIWSGELVRFHAYWHMTSLEAEGGLKIRDYKITIPAIHAPMSFERQENLIIETIQAAIVKYTGGIAKEIDVMIDYEFIAEPIISDYSNRELINLTWQYI